MSTYDDPVLSAIGSTSAGSARALLALCRALIRKGIFTEQEIKDALAQERKTGDLAVTDFNNAEIDAITKGL